MSSAHTPADQGSGLAPNEVDRLRWLGALMALAGAFGVIFSCLNWLTVRPVNNDGAWVSLTGLGSVASSGLPRELNDFADIKTVMADHGTAGGAWTLAFGALLLISSIPLLMRRNQVSGAAAGLIFSLASTITCFVYLDSPANGVLDSDATKGLERAAGVAADLSTGYGLWTVLIVSIIGIATSGFALGLSLARRGY